MGKFTLLTTLTLSAAGFNKGIDTAKRSSKALSDGVKTAGNTMANAFKPMGGILGSVSGSMAGLTQVAMGGVSAFKAMIPAINGVKMALISSGIGAIVVAVGTAFAALITYLKGTEEGSMKLKTVLGYVKGAFNALLVRVQLLGEAVSLVFEGKFKEAGQKLKEAFQGGLLEEIKADAEEAVGYAQRENQLLIDKRNLTEKEAQLRLKVSELDLIVYKKNEDAQVRAKALAEIKALELSLMKEKLRIAQEEYDIVAAQNAMSKSSTKDIEKETQLKNEIFNVQREYNETLLSYSRKENEINNLLKKQQEIIKETPIDVINIGDAFNNLSNTIVSNLAPLKSELAIIKPQIIRADDVEEQVGLLVSLRMRFSEEMAAMKLDAQLTGKVIFDALKVGINNISGKLIEGAESFKEYAKNVKNAIRDAIGAFIAEGVAALVGNALKSAAKTPYGFLMAAPLAALAGGIAKTAFNSIIPKFASGGIVSSPTMAMVGEYSNARSNPEVITPLSKLKEMLGGAGGGEVTFRIDGTQLVGVLNNYNRRTNSYR